jgi:RNA polymerase sigma-70 factor (ECF subfamily)
LTSTSAIGALRDAELVAMAAGGDAAAFDLLLAPRLDRLFRVAMAICRHESDARDATQNASVLAWRELPRLRDHGRFDAWISQILVNSCRATLRSRRRGAIREISADVGRDATAFGSAGGAFRGVSVREPATPPVEDRLAEQEAIQRAFERLSPDQRAILALHYVEERPVAEIGQLLQIAVGTVKWRLFRARRALDAALKAERQ